jgi:hypothetical protein
MELFDQLLAVVDEAGLAYQPDLCKGIPNQKAVVNVVLCDQDHGSFAM